MKKSFLSITYLHSVISCTNIYLSVLSSELKRHQITFSLARKLCFWVQKPQFTLCEIYSPLGFLCPYVSNEGKEQQTYSISPLGFTTPVKNRIQLFEHFKTFHSSPTAINLGEKTTAEGRYKMLHQWS